MKRKKVYSISCLKIINQDEKSFENGRTGAKKRGCFLVIFSRFYLKKDKVA